MSSPYLIHSDDLHISLGNNYWRKIFKPLPILYWRCFTWYSSNYELCYLIKREANPNTVFIGIIVEWLANNKTIFF